jgi:hypothetical protein
MTYHCWSVITAPRFSVNVYFPELSALAVETWWKLDWWASLRHSATWAPDVALPEITTFWPALEGSGDAVMVGTAGPHVGDVQHGVLWQQIGCARAAAGWVGTGQHVFVQHGVLWQQIGCARAAAGWVGTGQHVGTTYPRCCGQMMCDLAPAGPATTKTQRAAAEAASRSR